MGADPESRHAHDGRHRAARGLRGRRRRGARARLTPGARRGAASLVKLLALARRPPAAPRAGHRRAVARRPRRGRAARGCTRRRTTPAGRSATARAAVVLRNDQVAAAPGRRGVASTPSSSADARRAALAAGSVAERRGGPRGVRRAAAARRPLRAVGGRPRATPLEVLHRDLLRLAGSVGGAAARGPRRRGGAPRPGPAVRRPRRLRAALRQLERMDQALRRELGTVPSDAARLLRAELRPSRRRAGGPLAAPRRGPAGRSTRPVGDHVRERPGPGRRRPRQHRAAHRARRGRQDRRARPGRGPGPAPWLADRAAAAPRPSRARGPTRRCWRRSRDLCRRHPALLDGLDDNYRRRARPRPVRQGGRRGAARPRTSGCSSPRPS